MADTITLAIAKGRIYKDAISLLGKLNITPQHEPEHSRRLIIETNKPGLRLLIIRASDVPTYVGYGSADMGITGKDVLLEYPGDNIYEPLDLRIARCRMVLAGPDKPLPDNRRWRVATKYVQSTQEYFAQQGRQVEVIKLYGSMELAPLLDLADLIVDLVDTGETLAAHALLEKETLMAISSRLLVNKANMKMKRQPIQALINSLAEVINA